MLERSGKMSDTKSKRNPGVVNRSAPKSAVVPVLVYEDVSKAIEWLCKAFGLTERLRAQGPGGRVTHAQLSIGDGDVMIGASGAEFRSPRPNEVNQYVLVRVVDVERHFDHAKRFGARIVHPPRPTCHSARRCTRSRIWAATAGRFRSR